MTVPRKVGILTLPLYVNYGGILQAAALYRVLSDQGHQPVFLERRRDRKPHKQLARLIAENLPFLDIKGFRTMARRSGKHRPFIQNNMSVRSRPLRTVSDLRKAVSEHDLDAVIVGSDQVWRPEYHGDQTPLAYWLNFVDPRRSKRIAYAASFGKAVWERPDLDGRIAPLLADFHAVSVREASGIEICARHFAYDDAKVMIDPAMLVDRAFYDDIATVPSDAEGTFLNYILGLNDTSIEDLTRLGAELPGVSRTKFLRLSLGGDDITINDWVGYFRAAKYVFTDSFHGTALSILNEKPFVSLANKRGGEDRFVNVLGLLGLEDRLVEHADIGKVAELMKQPIDYVAVRARLEELRADATEFLANALA
ncbi:Polysaccharide pyruvyl transferase [Tsuneonella dongtanensis]|uniref:Polysaccharide pyruvyl transferase n=1 Tax=Tsuneonella dongtanensis TaxID=692370 RepID=A0A1B2AFC7_9SPHN|nr:polysaccharide pyruvyl transferase family protein [Tsuneonella dongtanensis]ANY20735.1 Polysaccharide pyruvyl transferase [Tsuneonella dongtanensis]